MRNHVSKVLIGTNIANVFASSVALEALTEGQIIAYDFDTQLGLVAGSKNIGFARGTAVLGEPIVVGPIPKAGISSAFLNPYEAPVKKKVTLTVSAVPTAGKTVIFKVVYHDNLSIIPNQMKQTAITVTATAASTTSTIATAIAAAFTAQEFKYVTATASSNVVTFEGITVLTASAYNGIDRPETVNFEVGAPDASTPELGTYVIATTVALKLGQGDPAKMAWMEDQAQGRRGYSDRTSWNDGKKYKRQTVAGQTYAVLVITADIALEGDMQGIRQNPIGVVVGGSGASLALVLVDLATAGVVPVTLAAS